MDRLTDIRNHSCKLEQSSYKTYLLQMYLGKVLYIFTTDVSANLNSALSHDANVFSCFSVSLLYLLITSATNQRGQITRQ